jgi:hypothetical protein
MKLMILPAAAIVLSSCVITKSEVPLEPNTLTKAEMNDDWVLLFNGKTTAGWRGFRSEEVPAGWQVEDGALVCKGPGGDILTMAEFGSFELSFVWKISEGGNSGVFFHVVEGDYDAVWRTGPEYQILDNDKHPDGANPLTSAAANYALHAPDEDRTQPVGEWNQGRMSVHSGHVEHWLNGKKVLEYELWSDEWLELAAASKFGAMPDYGIQKRGHIALQDHGDEVAFRSIKIKPLD